MAAEWIKISLLLVACLLCSGIARKGSRSRSTSTDHSRSSTASSVRPHVPARIGGHGDSPEIPPGDSFTPESPPEEDKDFLLPAIHTGGPATRPVTHPVPHNPSSPGWVEVPSDTSVMPGSYVDLQCKSSLLHLKTVWFLNGLQEITASSLAPRVRISNHGHSLTLGPLETGEEVVIGCRVVTEKYGVLPSPLATISVLSQPHYSGHYSGKLFVVAIDGRPFELDMGYTGSRPPSSFLWMKNGMLFKGDGVRVRVDHKSIIFTSVSKSDYGLYSVTAHNEAGRGQAYIYLKVLSWPFSRNEPLPRMSFRLALYVALSLARHNLPGSHTAVDSLGVMATIRRLLYHANPDAQKQGQARLEQEEVLEKMQAMTGFQGGPVSDDSLSALNQETHCTTAMPSFDCTDDSVLDYRTYDGSCNNFFFPLQGAALTPFPRLLPAEYEDGIASPVGLRQALAGNHTSPPWPSARQISWKIGDSDIMSDADATGITHMVMQWGQFLDHDLDLSPVFDVECGCNHTRQCHPIPVSPSDETFGSSSPNNATCLSFSRSIPACRIESTTSLPRDQINQITSYIDASQVYGSSQTLALSLRTKVGGLLKQGGRAQSHKGNLPFQRDRPKGGLLPFFIAGDERANEQTGLTVMHTLWLREHNRIARSLAELNPCWDDEKLYQEARKIVGAQMQKITFYDFLPVLFGDHMKTYIPEYSGYDFFEDASIPNSFAAGAYRFGHSLIRSQLLRLDENFTAMDIGHLDLSRAFFNPVTFFESLGTDGIARGLMVDVCNPVDAFLNPVLTSRLFAKKPGTLGGDLSSLNIQRGRDHGLPSYRTWQRFCENKFPGHPAKFDWDVAARLRQVYGRHGYEKAMDLWVGGLAEETLEGAQIGPTFACILGISFSRLRDGDRFWFEEGHQFSPEQREALKQTSLGRVVCDNGDNIRRVSKDVFRSNSVRVPSLACEQIPKLDLRSWRDDSCGSS